MPQQGSELAPPPLAKAGDSKCKPSRSPTLATEWKERSAAGVCTSETSPQMIVIAMQAVEIETMLAGFGLEIR